MVKLWKLAKIMKINCIKLIEFLKSQKIGLVEQGNSEWPKKYKICEKWKNFPL